MASKYSKRVSKAFAEISVGDYHVDSDGHWLTLKEGYEYMGGRVVHETKASEMLAARTIIEEA